MYQPGEINSCLVFLAMLLSPNFVGSVKLHLTASNYSPCQYHAAIESLYCNNQNLDEIPTVDKAMRLKLFNLDGNKITRIPSNAFANSSETLFTISIQQADSQIIAIDSNAFQNLNVLLDLKIKAQTGNQNIMNGPVDLKTLLSTLSSLVSLEMQNINIGTVRNNMLPTNSRIKEMTLVSCKVDAIEQLSFTGGSAIEMLNFSNTENMVNLNWLSPLSGVKELVLISNNLNSAKIGQLSSTLERIEKINFRHNQIEEIGFSMFSNVRETLIELDFSGNQLSESKTSGLSALSNTKFKKLILNENFNIRTIPKEVKQLQSLEYLELALTSVSQIIGSDFHTNSALKTLMLEMTSLESIHTTAFQSASQLTDLRISFQAPTITKNLDKLIIYTSRGTEPGNWTAVFEVLPNLQILSLQGYMDSTPKSGELTDTIWEKIRPCRKLRELILSTNKITYIPNFYLGEFPDLQKVDLQNNLISNISSTTFYLLGHPRNVSVNLKNNKISTLDNCTLAMYKDIEQWVNLRSNPLHCDCNLWWLYERLDISKIDMQCTSPTSAAGKTWNSINSADFCPSKISTPSKCKVLVPVILKPINNFPLNISIEKINNTAVMIKTDISKYNTNQFTFYKVQYGPSIDRNSSFVTVNKLLSEQSVIITANVELNQLYTYCIVLYNKTGHEIKHEDNCQNYTVTPTSPINAAALAGGVIGGILVLIIIIVIFVLCLKYRRGKIEKPMNSNTLEEDPYTYEYVDDRNIKYQKNQPQLRPESKRYTKKNNMGGSRPSLANSTNTLATSISSPGIGFQNGSRPNSGPAFMNQPSSMTPSQSMHSMWGSNHQLSGGYPPNYDQKHLSQSTEQLSARGHPRNLPQVPRQAQSQEIILDVMNAGHQRQPLPAPPGAERERNMSVSSLNYPNQALPNEYDPNYTVMSPKANNAAPYVSDQFYYPPPGTIVSKEEEMRARGYVPMAGIDPSTSSTDGPPPPVTNRQQSINNRPHDYRDTDPSQHTPESRQQYDNRSFDRANSGLSLKFESHF